ncbi:MAG: cyanophycin synthetase, partial [Dehalococcoidia bacterium]
TGLYTSPHLHDYTERIRINGDPISQADFASLTDIVRQAVDQVLPQLGARGFVTFDLLTALGFLAFRKAGVQVQVIEVGLGGRLDSTNVFDTKEVAVITPLSLEHTNVLGDTIEQIAAEKAAIITPGCTVVLALQERDSAQAVVRDFANKTGARLVDVAAEYASTTNPSGSSGQALTLSGPNRNVELTLPLIGGHQANNAATAVAAIDAIDPSISDGAVTEGLASVRWLARMEILHPNPDRQALSLTRGGVVNGPLVIADGAHNRDSARALCQTLTDYFAADRVTFIVGCSADKDIAGLAEELAPIADHVLAVRSNHPRSMDPKLISGAFHSIGIEAEDVDTVPAAIEQAMAGSGDDGVICLTGSLFVAAEGREYFGFS